MSITISTPLQICNSQLNLSKSKALYSFPKSCRFETRNKSLCDQFYEIPSSISKRKTSLGYGQKYDFTKGKDVTPAPNCYNFKTEIENKQEKKQGWSFGESRSKMNGGGIFKGHLKGIPGQILYLRPGTYESQSQLNKIKYSMRPKTANPMSFSTADLNPGPGSYDKYETIRPVGKIFVSKYKSSGATTIDPANSRRFKTNYVPGPGHYNLQSKLMAKDGKYFISNMTNSMCRSFTHQARDGLMEQIKEHIPGVGNYRLPSEFGYYESAKK